MKDIEKAIEIEKEYLERKLHGEYPFHLVDKIKECGFDSLAEYFKIKNDRDFKFGQFKIVDPSSPEQCIRDVFDIITQKKNAVIFFDIDSTVVWAQIGAECNVKYCLEHKIPIIPVKTNGNGALVSTPNDFGVGIGIRKDSRFDFTYFVNSFVDILRKYTDKEVINQGNDIMYDGKKVCGFTFYDMNDMFVVISPISFSEKSELVSNICTKPQIKRAGHIDFMSRDDLRKEVSEWLQIS